MFEWEDYHSEFAVMEKRKGAVLSDKFAMHFSELRKLKKETNLSDKKELWMKLINARDEEELNMINQTNAPTIKKAVLKLKQMSEDDRMKERARMREKALHDETSVLNSARQEGRQEGIEEIINKMRTAGMSEENIQKILNID